MMASLRSTVVLVLAASRLINAQAFGDLPACGQACINNLRINAGSLLGCTDNSQLDSCMCSKPDFQFGVRDCANQNCGAAEATTVINYASSFCATATASPVPATSAAATSVLPAAATTPAPASPPPTTTSASVSSSSVESQRLESVASVAQSTTLESTTSSSTSTSSTPTLVTAIPTSIPTSASSSSTSSTLSTSTTTKSSSSSSPVVAASTSTPTVDAEQSNASSSSLNTTAKIGIGVGAAAAVVVGVILAVFLCLRRRNRKPPSMSRSMLISDPLPGSGRTYANDLHNAKYTGGMTELELKSRPYEDMVPRQQPRLMV